MGSFWSIYLVTVVFLIILIRYLNNRYEVEDMPHTYYPILTFTLLLCPVVNWVALIIFGIFFIITMSENDVRDHKDYEDKGPNLITRLINKLFKIE